MYIDDFVWLTEIATKVAAKHRVTLDEAEEVFLNNPRYRFVESGHRIGENAGRYLIVFFIYKGDNTALILSARDMDTAERRRHERK